MIFPYGTDAPLYYRPIATIGLIAICVVIFIATAGDSQADRASSLVLNFNQVSPIEWLTACFMHEDISHLAGNMMFLWVFGLLVEGKLGPLRFIAVYLSTGVVANAVIQIAFAHATNEMTACGASGAISGLTAIALVWAPKNEINCAFVYSIGLVHFFEVPMTLAVGVYIGLDLLVAVLTNFHLSGSLCHILGAAIGAVIGVALLKTKRVDCEGWDIFSVIAGREGEREAEEASKIQPTGDEARLHAAQLHIRDHLEHGDAVAAIVVYQRVSSQSPSWKLPEATERRLITMLLAAGERVKAKVLLPDFIKRSGDRGAMRIELADILLHDEDRPSQAIAVLSHIPPTSLDADLERRRNDLQREAAQRKQQSGELELMSEEG
jgi:membrane associated rhomboid family serine protease